jgi:putative ABC transport system permease protein
MKIPLTLLTLLHQRFRTLIAIAGVGFSILLVFMQLGFFGSAKTAATIYLEKLDFDLMLVDTEYANINRTGVFPRDRLYQALAVPGVVSASPLWVNGNLWRIVPPQDADNQDRKGFRRGIMVVGFDVTDPVFLLPGLEHDIDLLKIPGNVLIDSKSRDYFGDLNPGVETDLGATRVTIVGTFAIGTSYAADGLLLMSDRTYSRIFGRMPLHNVNMGLLKFTEGTDVDTAAAALTDTLPQDEVRVLTREQMMALETNYWMNRTALGQIFFVGVVVSLVVGTVFVYQVLAGDITTRFPEYATLKALGYGNSYLSMLVMQQGLAYAVLGYVPGYLCSLVLYDLAGAVANLPIHMTWERALVVLLLAVGMCSVSALFALQKVKTADPADLF